MRSNFNLEIVTPEKKFFQDDVETVIVSTPEGEIGVLKDHIAMVTTIEIGPIKIKTNGEWHKAVLTGGFMEINQNKVVIVSDTAEWSYEIDIGRAEQAQKRAEERLQKELSETEFIRSQAALARAIERLKIRK